MKTTQSFALKNLKGIKGIKGIRSFPNAVPKEEVISIENSSPKEVSQIEKEKPQTPAINSSPSDKKDGEQLNGNLQYVPSASNILNDIEIKKPVLIKEVKKEVISASAVVKEVNIDVMKPVSVKEVKKDVKKDVISASAVVSDSLCESASAVVKSNPDNKVNVDELLSSLDKSSSDLHVDVMKPVKGKIVLPGEFNLNSTISNMYKKLGNSTTVEGFDSPPCHTFSMMNLKEPLVNAIINVLKWEYPSPIQSVGIMPVIAGRDLLCQAQAGTGKTATFMIAALQKVDASIRGCQAIVLSHNRELSEQTFKVAVQLATYMDISIASHIGGGQDRDERGVNYVHNVRPKGGKYGTEKYGEQIVIATPGRLNMLLNKGMIETSKTKLVILDEADNILSAGFMEDIGKIFRKMPDEIQYALYSATLSNEIIEMSEKFMIDPVQILVPRQENVVTDNQSQYTIQVESDNDKLDILNDIFTMNTGQVMVFCNRKFMVSHVANHIKSLGIPVGAINGEMEQSVREASMEKFRTGEYKVIGGTDIISRGIDTTVHLVINYDTPNKPDDYVHRIGRTGRFGKQGCVVNIATQEEASKIQRIAIRYKIQILPFSQFMSRPSIDI